MRWQAPELLVSYRFHSSDGMLSANQNANSGSTISKETDVYAFASVCLEVGNCILYIHAESESEIESTSRYSRKKFHSRTFVMVMS